MTIKFYNDSFCSNGGTYSSETHSITINLHLGLVLTIVNLFHEFFHWFADILGLPGILEYWVDMTHARLLARDKQYAINFYRSAYGIKLKKNKNTNLKRLQ